ncbi:serine/threonine-protein kinase [Micromonospora sp. C28SCA-DRY-2]|uniref:serine/threonine-protein kinase n=1 Tax=Micromonospora sp. C28SCA-DRY-2 TaxID=3059522 RepID=UPI002675D22C|nr:serine/threonine-protein kinase [Micromonospora sp. C28SCA-DRY-2]MDO3703365.1 serine/threonine-protein kinase [Micromonospora sp. C28SCA-DRY-2]
MRQRLIAGRYRLLDLVGTGGMGRIWLARDEMLHRDVAVKEIRPPAWLTESERDEVRLRTLREARTAARLNHPNVVRIYDVVHDGDSPWIVMEYVRSRSVHQILAADGPLSPRRTARIGLAVLAALRAAHAAGVLHRDVKPHNVLVADDGRVVLTDFGLATFDGGDGAMTGPGMVLGSPQFVAPERARDGISDPRTDLWSLGATLYAAVEGRAPYARPSAMATLSALATEPPDPMRRAGVLRPVLTGLLQRDPWRRLTALEAEPLLRAAADPDRPAAARPPTAEPAPPPAAGPTRPRPAAGATGPVPDGTPPPARAEPAGRAVRRARSTRLRRLVAAGLAATLLASVGVALSLAGRTGEPLTAPSGSGAGATDRPRPAAFACAATPPPGAAPVPSVPAPAGAFRLVDNWTWHVDPAGYRIAAPVAWLRWTDGAATCFREPDGARVLSVEAGPRRADPVAWWRAEERRLTGGGALPGYQRYDLAALDMFRGAAIWECAWISAAGDRVHTGRLLANVSADRAYTVSWLTKEFDWQVNTAYFAMIRQSFTPLP